MASAIAQTPQGPVAANVDAARAHAWREALAGYAAASILTLGIARVSGAHVGLESAGAVLLGSLAVVAMHQWGAQRVLRTLFVVMPLVALALLWQDRLPAWPYGDGALMGGFLEGAYVFPRWMLGMTAAVALHAGVWRFPPLASWLPAHLATGGAFAAILCLMVMAISSAALLTRWPRLPVQFALLTPVWVLFSSGYVEYYPLMIGAWTAALLWTFERPLRERPPAAVGALAGVLVALYIGLAPFAVLLVVAYAWERPRDLLVVVGATAVTLAVAIGVAYPTIPAYLQQLYAEMNLGDQHSSPRYAGLAASPTSLLLATRYVFRSWHLQDVGYMVFWGGGWLFGPMLLVVAAWRWRDAACSDARTWLGAALVAWQLFYVLWMIPKAGPQVDVDLFSPVFVTLAVLAGFLVEGTRARHVLRGATLGVAVATATYLVWLGLPPAY